MRDFEAALSDDRRHSKDFHDQMKGSGPPVDLITKFWFPIPSEVIGIMIGVPREDAPAYQKAVYEAIRQRKGARTIPRSLVVPS